MVKATHAYRIGRGLVDQPIGDGFLMVLTYYSPCWCVLGTFVSSMVGSIPSAKCRFAMPLEYEVLDVLLRSAPTIAGRDGHIGAASLTRYKL